MVLFLDIFEISKNFDSKSESNIHHCKAESHSAQNLASQTPFFIRSLALFFPSLYIILLLLTPLYSLILPFQFHQQELAGSLQQQLEIPPHSLHQLLSSKVQGYPSSKFLPLIFSLFQESHRPIVTQLSFKIHTFQQDQSYQNIFEHEIQSDLRSYFSYVLEFVSSFFHIFQAMIKTDNIQLVTIFLFSTFQKNSLQKEWTFSFLQF